MLKKLILATAALALSAPVLADNRDHRPGYHGKPHYVRYDRHYHVYRHYHPHRAVVVVQRPHPAPAILFGAVLGAAIAHHVITSR